MNPNLKAAIALASLAALLTLPGAPHAFASSTEWDDQNSDKSWTGSSPVVEQAADPVEANPAPAPVSVIPATVPAQVPVSAAPEAVKPATDSTSPGTVATAPASVPPVPISANAARIAPTAAPVSFNVPITATVSNHLSSISKAPEDAGSLVTQSSPYVHSEPRLAAPFPILLNDSVQNYVQDFLDQPEGLKLAFERSRPFMRDMVELLKKQGLPDDLVYLTFAESDFSKKGKGPWQFTAETAARFGLRVNKWLDERRDPILSTKAAAEYLAELHDQADNDWRVALIGWNTGEGNLDRYWLLQGANYNKFANRLPRRTRQLLNRFMAVAFIAHNPQAYGIGEVKFTEFPTWTIEKVKGGTLLSSIAVKFETTVAKLHDLNPALRADRVPPNQRTYAIRIPSDDTY